MTETKLIQNGVVIHCNLPNINQKNAELVKDEKMLVRTKMAPRKVEKAQSTVILYCYSVKGL